MHEADALIASVCDMEVNLRIEADAHRTIQFGALGDGTIPAQAPSARAGDHLDRPSLEIYTTNSTRFAIQRPIACARPLLLASILISPGAVCFACVGQEMI